MNESTWTLWKIRLLTYINNSFVFWQKQQINILKTLQLTPSSSKFHLEKNSFNAAKKCLKHSYMSGTHNKRYNNPLKTPTQRIRWDFSLKTRGKTEEIIFLFFPCGSSVLPAQRRFLLTSHRHRVAGKCAFLPPSFQPASSETRCWEENIFTPTYLIFKHQLYLISTEGGLREPKRGEFLTRHPGICSVVCCCRNEQLSGCGPEASC